jgi:hypothetical protein
MTTEDEQVRESDLSCTFCGPGTWAVWDVVTEDGVVFVCERHHVEMSEAKIIRLERRMGKKSWKKIKEMREVLYEEEYLDNVTHFEDINDY